MRQGQNRRMRGRNNSTSNRKGPNPLQRGYESNGPDVKVRGNAQHIAEKYVQLARDAQSSGDRVMAENYLQHAEHYFRLVLAAQEQLTLQYGTTFQPQRFGEDGEEGEEEGEEEGQQAYPFGVAQPSQNGDGGEGGFVQQGYDNQPRQDRGGQDRGGQDRGGQDRGNQERGGQERSEGRFDRNANQRFDRNSNRDRNNNNRDRNDRGQRPYERGDSQPDDQPRQDRSGSERFERTAAPRHQDNRQDNRNTQPREPEAGSQDAGDQPRVERDRGPRQPRERYERDRAPRAERPRPVEDDTGVAEALPAFLTNPVRVPVAVEVVPEARKAAPAEAAAPAPEAEGVEVAAKKPRGRPRRSPREVMDALATEPTSE
jgi:hypothetical protein